ncbi:MAG TPA: hypothetical protein VKA95_02535 [Nitrososphaeraceae archaeon]|nr:hypothetical protein [Nitrososphaeraceae archaeon]
MSVSPAKRIYIDTNVFIKQLYSKTHKYHHKVCTFFKDIQNQKLKGANSSFTKSEYLAVIKELMAADLSSAPPQKDIDDALKIFDDFIDQMGIEYFELQDLPFIDSTFTKGTTSTNKQGIG